MRQDLPIGLQAAQALHACVDFSIEHPEITKDWHTNSNYIVCLNARDETHLEYLIELAEKQGVPYSIFREPDIDHQITAIALAPEPRSRKITGSLPLLR